MVSKTESPVHDLSQEGRALQKARLLLSKKENVEDKIFFINLQLDISRSYYKLLNTPEAWVALNTAQNVANSEKSTTPETKEALKIQTGILHAADEREFKTMFFNSKRSDKEALKRLSERPTFYTDVYFMIKPKVCYAKYAKKFFDLVDIILSSSHVPIYIVAAFVKRLSRLLLNAPLYCQRPIISIIKNIMQRNKFVHNILINRNESSSLDSDPYDEDERDIKKSHANDSSLWELRAIQHHWHYKVAEKANFIDRHVQTDESHVEWKTADEIFKSTLKHSILKLKKQDIVNKLKYKSTNNSNEDDIENGEELEDDYFTDDENQSIPPVPAKRAKFAINNPNETFVANGKPLVKPHFSLAANAMEEDQKKFLLLISANDEVWSI